MDILLVTLGTAGDVHPFAALGSQLKSRNHRVTLITNEHFRPLAERMNLDFHPLGKVSHYQSVLSDPDIWHPVRGFKILVREVILGSMAMVFEAIEALMTDHTVVVAPCFLFGARIAREKLDVPLATLVLQPSSVWSTVEPTLLASLAGHPYLPTSLHRLIAKLVGSCFMEPLMAPETNRFRSQLGLAPESEVATRWLYSPDRVIGLFPEWFAAAAADWPSRFVQTGFVSHEARDSLSLADDCRSFLEEKDPPIVFTPGSGNLQASQFFAVASQVCRSSGQRGLFLTGYRDHLPSDLPPGVRHFKYVPFDQVFPYCRAAVHHGGIGTLSKALAAGIPQMVMPMAYDQPYNANRLKKLGVAEVIRQRHFKAPQVAKKLQRLIESESVARQCKQLSERIESNRAIADTCKIIEELGGLPG